jgi:hypothetical protein
MVTSNPIADGNEIQALTAIRALLAERLADAEGAPVAAISKELRAVLMELRRLGATTQESPLDEIAARRAKRRGAARPAETADPQRADVRGDGGPGSA